MRFRFTIRDCLFVTTIVGLAFGWWVDRRSLSSELVSTREDLQLARRELQLVRNDLLTAQGTLESQNSFIEAAQYHNWRLMAIQFAQRMRDEGWHVTIDERNTGYGMAPASSFVDKPGLAQKLNDEYPLPPPVWEP